MDTHTYNTQEDTMTSRDTIITTIFMNAIRQAEAEVGATTHDILYNILMHYDIKPGLLEWQSCPDGARRCIFCGNTPGQRHADDCPWTD